MAHGHLKQLINNDLPRVDNVWALCLLLLDTTFHLQTAPHHSTDPASEFRSSDQWLESAVASIEHFEGRGDPHIQKHDYERIISWINQGDAALQMDAIAYGIDKTLWPHFLGPWQERHADTHTLSPGDPYPVADFAKSIIASSGQITARPSNLRTIPSDELPHIRRHRPELDDSRTRLNVAFDHRFEIPLAAALEITQEQDGLGTATIHPNVDLSELHIPEGRNVFGVIPSNEGKQSATILPLLDRLVGLNTQVIVLPELTVTGKILRGIQTWLNEVDSPLLVAAGSEHIRLDGDQVNISFGLLPDYDETLTHRKFVPWKTRTGTPEVRQEEIAVSRDITIYTGGRFRVCLAICKDVMDPETLPQLIRLGVNVLLVPSMSRSTDAFFARATQLATDGQGMSVVANNPLRWPSDRPSAATFGQPVKGATALREPAEEHAPTTAGAYRLALGMPRATWHS